MDEKEGQVVSETAEKDGQTENEQPEKTAEEPTLEKTIELVKGLQKGFTQTRQEMSEIKGSLQTIADSVNKTTGATAGEDEYLTVGKLKEILNQQSQEQEMRKSQADQYIERALDGLKAEGKISTKEDEDELINFALEIKEPDLMKASVIFDKVKSAKDEAKKEIAKTKVKQEEGSKIGTSSKTSEGESRGIDYNKVQTRDWW